MTHLESSDKFRVQHGRLAFPVGVRTIKTAITLLALVLMAFLISCSPAQVSAANRMFLDLSLEFVGEYQLPESQPLSDLTYEITGYGEPTDGGIRFYGLAQGEAETNALKLYTLRWQFTEGGESPNIYLEDSLTLSDRTTQPRSIVFSPRKSIFVATDNSHIEEFDLETGQLKTTVPLPSAYLGNQDESKPPQGLQWDLGLKSLTIAPDGFSAGGVDPFRLFVAPEAPLKQDMDNNPGKVRILHYVIADRASFLVSENLYNFDEDSPGTDLAALVALKRGGSFLSLERSANSIGTGIYQIFSGDATDTSRIASLRGKLTKVQPLRKQLLFDLQQLGINAKVTGMTLGPRFPDGGQSLVVTRNNPPSLMIFRLTQS